MGPTWVFKIADLGKTGNYASLGLPALLRLHRLAEAVALAVHLQDLAVMRQAVQKRRRHPFPLEDLTPLAERQIARHQHAATLVAVAEDAEHQFDSATAQRHVAQLVNDQQLRSFELAKESVERVLLLSL